MPAAPCRRAAAGSGSPSRQADTVTHLALVGATASGKSALALRAVRAYDDLELVSMDSMQVYRGMDIGTAKPTRREQAAAHHHMIDIVDAWEEFSVVAFQRAARASVADIEQRGKRALLVGGTGLYVQAVVDDLQFPGEDLELRRSLEVEAATNAGLEAAFGRLRELDPVAASRIEPNNSRRVVRALEVIELTGRPFSSFGPGLSELGEPVFPVRFTGLAVPSAVLAPRIEARARQMVADGLVEEVRRLAEEPRGWSRSARQAIGYKEIEALFRGDEPDLESALESIIRRTRAFARRQRAWFRRDSRIDWFDIDEYSGSAEAQILASWRPV